MKKWVWGLLFWGSSRVVMGQATVPVVPTVRVVDEALGLPAAVRYYDKFWEPLPAGPAGAHCYDHFVRVDSAGLDWRARRYVLTTGQLILEQYFTGVVPGMELEGHSREWYENGQLREDLTYHKSRVVGVLRTYFADGKPRRTEFAAPVKGTDTCLDSTGRALAKCPPYHVFAQMKGKNTYSGKFLKQVQQQYAAFLPADYTQPTDKVVFYAFRIDPTGLVRNARVLTDASDELHAAILKAVNQLPAFTPATLEGSPTNDIVEGMLTAKAVKH